MGAKDTAWVEFKMLRERITLRQVLEHFNLLHTLRGQSDQRAGPCPVHGSDSPDSHAFSVNLAKNGWHCFKCGGKGNQLDFWAAYRKVPVREAALEMAAAFGVPTAAKPPGKLKAPTAHAATAPTPAGAAAEGTAAAPTAGAAAAQEDGATELVPLTFQLKLDPAHAAVQAWGLKPETIAAFGAGYCSRGIMKGRVAWPLHDPEGHVVGYAGRAVTDELAKAEGKWRLPAQFPRRLFVFNLWRARRSVSAHAPWVIVEGIRGCVSLVERGWATAVALLGNQMSPEQADLLKQYRPPGTSAVVLLDGNPAGRTAAPAVVCTLARRMPVSLADLPPDAQPDSVDADTLRRLLEPLFGPPPSPGPGAGLAGLPDAFEGP